MSKLKTFFKALAISIKIKGAFSIFASILGFATAFIPVFIASKLRELTDILQNISGITDGTKEAFFAFAIIVMLYIAQVVILNLQQYANGIDTIKIQKYIKKLIMRHKCEVRYKFIENFDDFQKRLSFIEQYAGHDMAKCISSIITILQTTVLCITASTALWVINPIIVVILIITSIPAALLSFLQADETFRGRAKWIEEGSLAIHYFHMIAGGAASGYSHGGQQEIRHFGLFDYLKARWRAIADDYLSKKNKIMSKHLKYNIAADFLRSAVYIGILLMAAWSIYQNPMIGLGAFTLVFTLSSQLQSATADTFVGIMLLVQNIPYMEELFYLENVEREEYLSSVAETNGEISFKNVSFSYPNSDIEVLKNINVNITEGEKIAIVGENGSGKSTFISLLCGMFDPKCGEISVGGVDVKQHAALSRSGISVVFQDFAQYETTLRENITVSDKNRNASDDEIMKMLDEINIDDVIAEQKHGLNELVGSFSDKANNLSGGQWQKISIARAAYRNKAKIMILDEPTSALDPIAEAELYRNFNKLTGNKTTLLISHRLGITAIVDRILVFKDGEIIEDGSHKELMSKKGHYAEMYMAQARWYAPS